MRSRSRRSRRSVGWQSGHGSARVGPQEAQLARQRALQVAGRFASSEILKEINRRFDILNQLATETELRQQMVRINEKPKDEALWKRLEDWLGRRKGGSRERRGRRQLVHQRCAWRAGCPQPAERGDTRRELLRTAIIFPARALILPPDTKEYEADQGAAFVGRLSQYVDRPFEGCVFGADRKRSKGEDAK